LPFHDNRFFSSMSQCFEAEARQRGWCPVIASTLRDSAEEIRTVETLISYSVDYLFIAGATEPDALSELCQAANLPHVYIDLPGRDAPSVVSDNYHGAQILTKQILDSMPRDIPGERGRPYMLGGLPTDYASALRMTAFRETIEAAGLPFDDSQIIPSGYSPGQASRDIAALCERLGGLPAGLFVNSIRPFEGVVSHFVHRPPEDFTHTVIGCYDYDPFATFLQFPVHMIRQNSNELMATAFRMVDAGTQDAVLVQVEPELIPPRTIYTGPLSEQG
jgi:LacI family fructose operon transcriptional repressor